MTSHRRRFAALVAALAVAAPWAASGSSFTPTVTTTSIDGQTVADGQVAQPVRAADFTVAGTAATTPPLTVDAGDSAFVRIGEAAPLEAIAANGTAPYTFTWSLDGSEAPFSPPDRARTTLETASLAPGTVTARVEVTDADGRTVADTVKVAIWTPRSDVVVDETVEVGPGVPDEDLTGLGLDNSGAVDGETHRFPFTLGDEVIALDLELSWTTHDPDPAGVAPATMNDFDLYVDDPSDAHDENIDGATAERPERISIVDPAAGAWAAQVSAFLNGPDTFHLTATATSTPPNPLPTIATAGPFRFAPGETQRLQASVTGAGPLTTQWDLDLDGLWDATGTEVIAAYPLGTHLAVVKVTDAAGFEERQMVGVRVVEATTTVSPLVVIAVTDSGVNLYHDDFNARAFPDPTVLEVTGNFTRHPSEYLPGFPAEMPALPISHDAGYYPPKDHGLFTGIDVGEVFWVPGTKVVAARDGGNEDPTDLIPILDDEFVPAGLEAGPGHGTASASVAVGNQYGNCPTCLLVFNEDINGDRNWVYDQPWIDIVSNSYGPQSNIGSVGGIVPFIDFGDGMPKEAAERGQLGLFASGNGNENGFITPQQTYTSELSGPGWVLRIGAVERSTRKPILGDGNPVDVSSFGSGDIPAANYEGTDLDNDIQGHSGTSAATPLTSGVFGTVLREARRALGDTGVGQRPGAVIAKGTPYAASTYLADGELTAAEIREIVLKTAEHDAGGDVAIFPTTTPNNPAQFAVEGYGVADKESAARAVAVLLGTAPIPERAPEDAFFAADYALRDAIWGGWSGGGSNTGGASTSSSPLHPNPFTGVSVADVADIDDALALVVPHATAAPTALPGSGAETGSLQAAITSPASGATIDPRLSPQLTVTGTSSFPPFDSGPSRLYLRRDACGAATEEGDKEPNPRLERRDGPDDGSGCGYIPGASALSLVVPFVTDFPLITSDLPLTIAGGNVSGVLHYQGEVPSPIAGVKVQLVTRSGGADAVIGEATVTRTVVGSPVEGPVPFAFSFPVAAPFAGRTVSNLILRVEQQDAQGSLFLELDDPASYVDVPEVRTEARHIEVTLDDTTFTAPVTVVPAVDGRWTASLPISDLPDGPHVLRARAVQGAATSTPSSTGFTSARSDGEPAAPPYEVQVQVVKRDAVPQAGGWLTARDTSATGDLSTWSAAVRVPKGGKYDVYSRMLVKGTEASRHGPVAFSRAGNNR